MRIRREWSDIINYKVAVVNLCFSCSNFSSGAVGAVGAVFRHTVHAPVLLVCQVVNSIQINLAALRKRIYGNNLRESNKFPLHKTGHNGTQLNLQLTPLKTNL